MKCIFCLEERAPTTEHVFPLAIGGCLTTERGCQICNSTLGTSADAPLVEHPLVILKRWQLKIPDRGGRVPDALGKLLREGTLAEDGSKKFRIATDPNLGYAKLELLHGERDIVLPDGSTAKQVSVDAGDPEAAKAKFRVIFQRERKRNDLAPLSSEELERMVLESVKQEPQTIANQTINSAIKLDLFGFKLGLFKIAYELAFLWPGEDYLHDPVAAQIRAVLMAPSREQAIAAADRIYGQMASPYDDFAHAFILWNDDPNAHIAFAGTHGQNILILVRIFTSMACAVVVTNNAAQYATGPHDPKVIRFIHLNPVAQTSRETSLTDEIGRLYLSGKFALHGR